MNNNELVHEIYKELKDHSFIRRKTFFKNETIANFINNRKYIYFVLSGNAALIKNTKYGDEELIEFYDRFDFFGDNFYHFITNNELSVVARNDCDVFFFDFERIHGDIKYFKVLKDIFELLNNKMINMNAHAQILKEKTIRNKLLVYFDSISRKSGNRKIEIDVSYKELASYLSVDRSSMMREIKTLESDKMISRNKKNIWLLYK